MRLLHKPVAYLILLTFVALVGACGGDTEAGVRVVSPETAADTLENPPEGLVVLDVRTPEEFEEVRIDGATMIDFYELDFADQIGDLDPDQPYLLYCRSGNRSGQTRALMEDLGFTNVIDIEGGILNWLEDGQPVTSG